MDNREKTRSNTPQTHKHIHILFGPDWCHVLFRFKFLVFFCVIHTHTHLNCNWCNNSYYFANGNSVVITHGLPYNNSVASKCGKIHIHTNTHYTSHTTHHTLTNVHGKEFKVRYSLSHARSLYPFFSVFSSWFWTAFKYHFYVFTITYMTAKQLQQRAVIFTHPCAVVVIAVACVSRMFFSLFSDSNQHNFQIKCRSHARTHSHKEHPTSQPEPIFRVYLYLPLFNYQFIFVQRKKGDCPFTILLAVYRLN